MAMYIETDAAIAQLSPEQYRVTQTGATERPRTGAAICARADMTAQGYGEYLDQVEDI